MSSKKKVAIGPGKKEKVEKGSERLENPCTKSSGVGFHFFELLIADWHSKEELAKKIEAVEGIRTKNIAYTIERRLSAGDQILFGFRVAKQGDKYKIVKTGLERRVKDDDVFYENKAEKENSEAKEELPADTSLKQKKASRPAAKQQAKSKKK